MEQQWTNKANYIAHGFHDLCCTGQRNQSQAEPTKQDKPNVLALLVHLMLALLLWHGTQLLLHHEGPLFSTSSPAVHASPSSSAAATIHLGGGTAPAHVGRQPAMQTAGHRQQPTRTRFPGHYTAGYSGCQWTQQTPQCFHLKKTCSPLGPVFSS